MYKYNMQILAMEELKRILFIDIETVPIVSDYQALTETLQKEWTRKSKFIKGSAGEQLEPAAAFERAGIYSEFAKVVCIGMGSLQQQNGAWQLRLKSLTNDNETILLKQFCDMLGRFVKNAPDMKFSGHNIKEFDIPFLCRRMVINGICLPDPMQIGGKKPWEISHVDTLEMWRFGDYKHYTSLALLAAVLDIPSPKEDIDGSMVADVYWKDKDLPRIAKYCLQDVLTSAKVFLKLKGINNVSPEAVYVDE